MNGMMRFSYDFRQRSADGCTDVQPRQRHKLVNALTPRPPAHTRSHGHEEEVERCGNGTQLQHDDPAGHGRRAVCALLSTHTACWALCMGACKPTQPSSRTAGSAAHQRTRLIGLPV